MIKFLLLIILSYNLFAFTVQDTVIAKIGEKYEIEFQFDSLQGNCTFSGTIILDNPTMIYPEGIEIINGNYSAFSFIRQNDSTYNFDISFEINQGTKLYLMGEALAGNNTVSLVKFVGMKINNEEIEEASTIIKTDSQFGNLIYYTRDRILGFYPNPLRKGEQINIRFETGAERNVKFLFYNESGLLIKKTDEFRVSAGENTYGMLFGIEQSSGAVYFIMQTDGFDDSSRFIYIK